METQLAGTAAAALVKQRKAGNAVKGRPQLEMYALRFVGMDRTTAPTGAMTEITTMAMDATAIVKLSKDFYALVAPPPAVTSAGDLSLELNQQSSVRITQ